RLAMKRPTEVIRRTRQRCSISAPFASSLAFRKAPYTGDLRNASQRPRMTLMPIKAFADINCSIAKPLSVLGERWALLVVRDASLGRRRFDDIEGSLGVATNVLSQRLATLTEEGSLGRRAYSERPERFEYRLTEKGRDLMPVLWALMRWGDKWTAEAGPPLE